jgi:hypothetical protein
MISFKSFCEEKELIKCAELMSNFDIEPSELIENVLESDLVEDWKGWMGGAGRALKAAGQVAGSLVSGGLKHGVKQAADTMGGPARKFDQAVTILKELEKYLRSNPATKDVASTSKPQRSVAGYIQLIYQALEKEKGNMPMVVPASQQLAKGGQYAMRGNQQAPQKQQAAQQQGNQQRQKLPSAPAQQTAQQPQAAPAMKIAQ